MKYLLMLLAIVNSAYAFDVVPAEKARQTVKEVYQKIDSFAYQGALKRINVHINTCALKGDRVCLINMDGAAYGTMYDTIEAYLIKLGYEAKWNHVGGIPGTSYTMFLQVSW